MARMTLGEAAYRVVTGTRSLRTEGRAGYLGWMAELSRGKTQRQVAAELGVDRRTWQRWLAGSQAPRPASLDLLKRAVRRSRLARSRERRLTGPRGQRQLVLKGLIRVSADVRDRKILPGQHLSDNPPRNPFEPDNQWTFARLVRLYLSGAGERILGDELDVAIQKYTPGMEVIDVEWIRA